MGLTTTGLLRMDVHVKRGSFRPIYYLGCKNEFAEEVSKAILDVDPSGGRLGDIFAGTGAVAAALAGSIEVLTADVQEYSRVLCSAILRPHPFTPTDINKLVARVKKSDIVLQLKWCFQPLIDYETECVNKAGSGSAEALVELLESEPIAAWMPENEIDSLLSEAMSKVALRLSESHLWDSPNSTVSRMFGGVYFSFSQAVELDALLVEANYNLDRADTLVSAALSTASNIVNTVGKQFAQPIRPRNKSGIIKSGLVKVVSKDRSIDTIAQYEDWLRRYANLPKASGQPIVLKQDYLSAVNNYGSQLSVLYADPPYTRDHYSRFYHVLETMCLRDNPDFSKVKKDGKLEISRGLYREDRYQSEFCIRSRAPKAFGELFKVASDCGLPLVLSYSPHDDGDGTHPRVVSTEQILTLANQHYDRVELVSIQGSSHNNFNRAGLKLKERDTAEILVKCYV